MSTLILGIDTSCDDTAASVLKDGERILSNIVSSQTDIHKRYGGIVPELASRKHIELIIPVVDNALTTAGVFINEINAIAVCNGPGLIGSLLVGCCFAKALSYSKKIPLLAINHLEGHIFSIFLEEKKPSFPFLSLIVSGGHTSLFIVKGFGEYIELGKTRDDAAGEAFDKVAKILQLGYPGGPIIDRLSKYGDPKAFDFPRAYLPETFDFSFSGLKTAVRSQINKLKEKNAEALRTHDSQLVKDIAASFQSSVVDVLVRKLEWAIIKKGIKRVTLSGGVAANSFLRERVSEMAKEKDVELFLPSIAFCTDNAAMIAAAGFNHFLKGRFADLSLNPKANLPLR